jgi:hypothetical protein
VLRPLLTFTLAVAIAPAIAAQEKPAPAVQQAFSATWQFDQAHSDTVSGDPLAGAAVSRGITGGSARSGGGSSGSGSGSGRGGRSGSGPVTPTSTRPADTAAPPPVERPNVRGDPHQQIFLADVDPGVGLVIAANDSVVAMATAAMAKAGTQVNWKTDGKKHQDAQMDGSIIETQATWKDGVLTLIKGVAGIGSLKREFEVSKDGMTLKVKESIEAGGRKAEKKLVFTRRQ